MDDSAAYAWLDEAIREAEKSFSEGGIPIGSVLVSQEGQIIARGHNRRVQEDDPTAHAEMVCIRRAGRRRDWGQLTLVSTLSPCPMCTGTAILLNIPRVVIGENRTYQGAERWLDEAGVKVTNLNDERCVELMRQLQRTNPDLWAEDVGK